MGAALTAIASSLRNEWQLLDAATLQYWRRDVAQLSLIGLVAMAALMLLVRAVMTRQPGRQSVVLPAIRPALAVLGLLTFVATWNEFQWPLITLNGTANPTAMVAISDLASGVYVQYRRVLSGAFVATLPLIVMLFIGGRQIVRGIMEGAVKQ